MDDLYLDNIDEFINDQNKIVTYKWLSLTLGVHVNTAKQMLYHYLEKKRKESSGSLHATFLITGKYVENGSTCHKVSVVREDKLEAAKAKMDVTISVHVYSLQRSELKDSAPLYSTDYDALKENMKNCNKYSAIRCAAAVPMSSAELQRVQELASVPPAQKEVSKPDLNENTSATSKPSAKQPVGIMGMFASKSAAKSQESSKEVKTEQKDDSSVVETSKNKPTSKANPMSNFFGKSAQKKADETPNKSIKIEKDGGSTASATVSKKSQLSSKSGSGIKEEQTKVSKSLKNESQDTRNKTKRPEVLDSDDENMESQKKKRRRIKNPQPDSSDDEVVPDSPPVPNVQTPSPKKQVKREPVSHQEESSEVKRRKRRRVLKSTTFVDEEGNFVTEKGYVSESYSESEESEPNRQVKDTVSLKQTFGKKVDEKKEKSQKKPAAASNKAKKQPSIVGFFQKK